ncbi:NUDIX hydrolase [Halieaceae bacterium]|nr:NUDIX hydrolase [Halieaceae bacterium]
MPDWYPHVTVATVIERDGKFLLVEERSSGRLVYNQPAGHVEQGETLFEAALRETLEESRWQVELKGVIGITLYTTTTSGTTYNRTAFYADPITECLDRAYDKGIERAVWMSYDEIIAAKDKMRSDRVIKTIDQYLSGHRYPLELIYGD